MWASAKRLILALALVAGWGQVAWAAGTNVATHVCSQVFAPTTLSSTDPNPTVNTSAAVDGTANPRADVVITVNGVQKATLTADASGNFAASVPLAFGDNTIIATASDGPFCGHSAASPPLVIHRNQVPPPAPQISQPASGLVTTSGSVSVQGSAEAGSQLTVWVNNAAKANVLIGADGLFDVTVPLALGSNTIQAQAANAAGTGPLSAPATVTRQPPSIQSGPPPTPSAPPPPRPLITSPADGATTTDASLLVSLAGPARATAVVQVGGAQVASVQLAADGTGEVSVPLQLGDNVITVSVGAATSAPVTVHRTLAPVVAPAIASPTDGTRVSTSTLRVTGSSAPGAKVALFVGLNRVAEVTADASGQFAVDVTLKPGSNLVYAAVDDATGLGPKSKVIEVIFSPPAASSGPIAAVGRAIGGAARGVGKLAATVTGAVAATAGAAVGQATQAVKQLPKPVVHSIPFAVMALFGFNIILLLMGVWRELRESNTQKRLLTRLKAVNEAKTTFIGLASHYLRTPLTTLLGGIEMLQEEKTAARAVLAQAAKAAEIGKHMRATVQSLLEHVEERTVTPHAFDQSRSSEAGFTSPSLWLNPAFYVPVLLTVAAWQGFDYLVRRAGVVHVKPLESTVQILIFITLATLSFSVLRYRQLRRRDARELEVVIKGESAVGQARDELIASASDSLGRDMASLEELAIGQPSSLAATSFTDGKQRIRQTLNKFKVAASLRGAHSGQPVVQVKIGDVLDGAVEPLQSQIATRNIQLKLPPAPAMVWVSDTSLLQRVLSTLVDNAVAYSHKGGEVEVRVKVDPQSAAITVTDHGSGIPAEKLSSLFQPFFKAEGAEVFTHEGMGFSLYLDKLIMTYLGGSIELNSTHGSGTTATITLPQSV